MVPPDEVLERFGISVLSPLTTLFIGIESAHKYRAETAPFAAFQIED